MDFITTQVKSIKIHQETHAMLERWRTELEEKWDKNVCFDTVIRYLSDKKNIKLSKKKIVDNGPPWAGF